jgi:hypothetical protein
VPIIDKLWLALVLFKLHRAHKKMPQAHFHHMQTVEKFLLPTIQLVRKRSFFSGGSVTIKDKPKGGGARRIKAFSLVSLGNDLGQRFRQPNVSFEESYLTVP